MSLTYHNVTNDIRLHAVGVFCTLAHCTYSIFVSHTLVLDYSVFFPLISSTTSPVSELLKYGWQGWL